jgi:hypothetical protein
VGFEEKMYLINMIQTIIVNISAIAYNMVKGSISKTCDNTTKEYKHARADEHGSVFADSLRNIILGLY